MKSGYANYILAPLRNKIQDIGEKKKKPNESHVLFGDIDKTYFFSIVVLLFNYLGNTVNAKKYRQEPAKTCYCTSEAVNHTEQRLQGITRPPVISKATFDLENCQDCL